MKGLALLRDEEGGTTTTGTQAFRPLASNSRNSPTQPRQRFSSNELRNVEPDDGETEFLIA